MVWELEHTDILFGDGNWGSKYGMWNSQKTDSGGASEKGHRILIGAIMETKCGPETEGKATKRLPYLGIHPINGHQTPTMLWTTKGTH